QEHRPRARRNPDAHSSHRRRASRHGATSRRCLGGLEKRVPVSTDEIRAVAQTLPRSYEVFVHGRIKFRVGQIVWLALSKDGARMGCGFPKELRQAAVETEPHKFELPSESDMRLNRMHVRLDAIDAGEMRDSSRRRGRERCRSMSPRNTGGRGAIGRSSPPEQSLDMGATGMNRVSIVTRDPDESERLYA